MINPGKPYAEGWAKTETTDLIDLDRQDMAELPPGERIDNFDEIVAGYDPNQAIIEASRCVQCGMCHDACPTHMDAPEYIRAIWEGDPEEAVRQIYRTNPFAHTCGRVCTHRCETACSIGKRGEPIAIRWLKRYAMDAFTPEQIRDIVGRPTTTATGRKIAIVGSGPAGLTAAALAREEAAASAFGVVLLSGLVLLAVDVLATLAVSGRLAGRLAGRGLRLGALLLLGLISMKWRMPPRCKCW